MELAGDFNVLQEDERGFSEDPIITNLVDVFFQEVEIMLTTERTDVYGRNEFGLDLQTHVWRLGANAGKINDLVSDGIRRYCFTHEYFKWEVDVRFMGGAFRDIALITINVIDVDNQLNMKKSFIFQ